MAGLAPPVHCAGVRSGTVARAAAKLDGGNSARTSSPRSLPLQRKLVIGPVNDPLEHEADRVAEQVMRMPAPETALTSAPLQISRKCAECEAEEEQKLQRKVVGTAETVPSEAQRNWRGVSCAPDQPLTVAGTVTGMLQRAADASEDEAEAAATAAVNGPAIEGDEYDSDRTNNAGDVESETEQEEDEGGAELQAKFAGNAVGIQLPSRLDDVSRRIDQVRDRGSPIEVPVRSRLELAFGADFSGVRVHTNNHASALAKSVQALAFTRGRDIFFAEGQYDPGSVGGRHLLAHELTHVLQQGAAPAVGRLALSATQAGSVQRKPDAQVSQFIGVILFFDEKDAIIDRTPIRWNPEFDIRPGYYEIELTSESAGVYKERIKGVGTYWLTAKSPGDIDRALRKAKRIFLVVFDQIIQLGDEPKQQGKQPSSYSPTGPAARPGDRPPAEAPAPAPQQGQPAEIKKGEVTEERRQIPSGSEQKEAGELGGEQKEVAKPGAGLGGPGKGAGLGEKKGGSKYGWLGLIPHLPDELASLLDGIIDALGDGEELRALRDTLQALVEVAQHRDELTSLFKDSTSFLEVALGLKDNKAIAAIGTWALEDVKDPKPAKNKQFKGIIDLAVKVSAMARKVRRLLRPIFQVRNGVQSALGTVGLLLEAVPVLEQLIELSKDPAKIGTLELQTAADQFVTELSDELEAKLQELPALLKQGFTKLTEADLISYEEIARGVTNVITSLVPKQYKPIVIIVRTVGLEKGIADNVVAPNLIPKSMHDKINDALRSIIKLAEPVFNAAVDDVKKILDELASGLLEELPNQVLSVLKPSSKPNSARRRGPALTIARLIGASSGEPFDEELRAKAETDLGFAFGNVRVHHDAAAAEASERLNANAFTIGNHLFFGPGKFAPGSAEGRRLLYHELTHVAQQAERGRLDLQPDYKDLLKRLSKRISPEVIAVLKGATTRSPSEQKQITEIKNKVEKLLGRKVESLTPPKPGLPPGYVYISKPKWHIRRTLRWIRYIPALHIDKNRRIKLTATLDIFDWKAPHRARLRRALGCDSSRQEAHHVIPLELYDNAAAKVAVKNGFKFDGADNGVCISKKFHSGSHSEYTKDVRLRLERLNQQYGTDWTKLKNPFRTVINRLKTDVKARRKRLE
jgi:hypothetical protein